MKHLKVIFFDMGNTLLYFHKGPSDQVKDQMGIDEIVLFLKKNKECEISSDLVKSEFVDPWMRTMPLRKTLHKEFSIDEFIGPFTRQLGIALNSNERIEMMKAFDAGYQRYLEVAPDADQTLKTLKSKFKLGVISNSPSLREVNIDHFKSVGLDQYIDHYIFSYDQKIGKPLPLIFNRALELFQIRGNEALMVGDSLVADIEGAQNVNMYTAWLNPTRIPNESKIKPDIEIETLQDLIPHLI